MVESQVRSEYQGKVLTLRHLYCGDRLHFNADGEVTGSRPCGSWTTNGQVRIKDLHLAGNLLRIEARRLLLAYDASSNQFRDVFDVNRGEPLARSLGSFGKKKQWKKLSAMADMELELESGSAPQITDIQAVMRRVFASPEEDLADLTPDHWRSFIWKMEGKPPKNPLTSQQAFTKVGGDVRAPRTISTPDPSYTEVARQAGYQGTSVLWLIVDAEGKVRDLKVAKALGLGLDDQAVESVRTWKFEPAKRGGTPVAVQINVEVSFRLY